jgi:hypothetical protein
MGIEFREIFVLHCWYCDSYPVNHSPGFPICPQCKRRYNILTFHHPENTVMVWDDRVYPFNFVRWDIHKSVSLRAKEAVLKEEDDRTLATLMWPRDSSLPVWSDIKIE